MKHSPPWPETQVTFLSRILFLYCWKFLLRGYKTAFNPENLWDLDEPETTTVAYHRFLHEYDRKSTTLFATVFRIHWRIWLVSAVLKLINDLCTFVIPVIVIVLIQLSNDPIEPRWHGYIYVAILFVAQLIRTLTIQNQNHLLNKIGIRIRSALSACIYRKALKLSPDSRRTFSSGEIQNLISIDAARFSDQCLLFNLLWSAPLQLCLGMYFLYRSAGHASWAGVGVIIVMVSISTWTSKVFQKFLERQMNHKDERMKIFSEMIKNMKLIKFFAWEQAFETLIERIRASEIECLRSGAYFLGFLEICWSTMNNVASLAIYAVFIYTNAAGAFDAEVAFIVAAIFYLIYVPLLDMPMAFAAALNVAVSFKRLQRYFQADEIVPYVSHCQGALAQADFQTRFAVSIDKSSLGWGKCGQPLLKNVSLNADRGQLIAVVGPVGAGKSSLLSAILGEMHLLHGTVEIEGSVAYVPQHPWILNDTLRSNILFGKEHDQEFYSKVLDHCALRHDLSVLTAGDMTEIGERGINLSGGQKQRISLARAIYQGCDIYLLDDPLSAVDVHVGVQLFSEVIGPNGLLGGKTRILVTHSLSYLHQCDMVAIMDEGQVIEFGTYADLNARGLLQRNETTDKSSTKYEGDTREPAASPDISSLDAASPFRRSDRFRESSREYKETMDAPQNGKLTEEESFEAQSIWPGFKLYVKAAGACLIMYAVTMALAYTCDIVSTIWLQTWTDQIVVDAQSGYTESGNVSAIHNGTRKLVQVDNAITNLSYKSGGIDNAKGIGIYAAFIGAQILLSCAYVLLYVVFSTRASRLIHTSIFGRLIRAPMCFFDATPTGRILNRFGKDMNIIDNEIPFMLRQVMQFLTLSIVVYIPTIYAVPLFAIVILPAIVIFVLLQVLYVRSARQFRRLEAISRSPIYSRFHETLQGLDSLRAYKKEQAFCSEADALVDANNRAQMSLLTANVWLSLNLEFVSTLVIVAAGFLAVWKLSTGDLSPGMMGVSISVIVSLTENIVWGSHQISTMETEMVSLERVQEYMKIPSEASWTAQNQLPSSNWPTEGCIEFRKYSTRYRPDLPLVLKNLNLRIGAGEKVHSMWSRLLRLHRGIDALQIGIVGRTGSGKSTLVSSLFRLLEPSEGTILIDSVDITQIGLQDLRRKLTIIPQEPSLFIGTLRYNLDPFQEFSDQQLWKALEASHMKDYVEGLPQGFETLVDEGGGNLSAGQRQLLCLARAILRRSRILILDEATASVDHSTDQLIQETIRSQFVDCTVLTIAHRVGTILDYDKALVMDNGMVAEYGQVKDLLVDETSRFSRMAIGNPLEPNDVARVLPIWTD